MRLVNVEILRQPWNWLIVILVALFWLVFLAVVTPQETGELSNAES